jgi:hypothetical protein
VNTYFHEAIGDEIKSISGSLTVLEELVLDFHDRKVLCIVNVGIIDNACCGSGGCLLVEIPGFILSGVREVQGQRISEVLPVENEQDKNEIAAALNKLYPNAQTRFS